MKAVQKWKKEVDKIPAVEVDAPGSSINPDRELHQDVVAEAVAIEMKKQYDRELLPVAPPRIVEWDDDYQKDEREKLLAEPASEESDESDEDEDEAQASRMQRRKTLKDRNRQLRHKKMEGEIARKRKEKKKLQDLEIVKKISKDVEETLTEREERIRRRQADREEMEKSMPPRLGRHEFKPLSIQVMTTDELQETGGSLRKLKPTPVLAKERYKSLQKRGIIEPRVKVNQRRGKRKVVIHGKRADNAEERQNEIREMQQKNKRSTK
jgi:nucleolar protein 53